MCAAGGLKLEDTSFASKIQELKKSVNKMLIERNRLTGTRETVSLTPVWSDLLSAFSYVMNLSVNDLRNIRFHSSPISGPPLWHTWYPCPEPDPEEKAKKLGYVKAISGLPEKYWIGEPPTPRIPRPSGVNYKGHIVNFNIARFQGYIRDLYRAGALDFVEKAEDKQLIVEIGGGYGGLAHNLGTILDKKATYLIIDLPELFMFQGAFLAVNNPEKSIYVYDNETFNSEFLAKQIYDYDFVLAPNYMLDKLNEIKEIAIFMNMHSFQEMSEKQVQEYVDFARDRVTYCIFSDNFSGRHPYNRTDLTSVSAILEASFDLYPSPKYYDDLYQDDDPSGYPRYRRYVGFPKDSERTLQDWQMPNYRVPVPRKVSLRRRLLRMLVPFPVRRAVGSLLMELAKRLVAE